MKTDQKKILIATGIYPPDIGGPATIIGELEKSLEQNGFSVQVITYSESAASADGVVRIKKNNPWSKLSYLFNLLKLSFSADIIYATDTYSVGYFAYLIKKIRRKPYVLRFAGDSAWETAFGNGWISDYIVEFQKNLYGKKIERMKSRRAKILCSADRVIAVSEFMSRIAQAVGVPEDRIKVIYNSVDFEKSKPLGRQEFFKKYGLSADDKLLMTACRLTPWKGVAALIKITKALLEKYPVKLMVLGDGPELQKLKALARDLKVEDAVIFAGIINQADMIGYFGFADAFILNTYYEGLSHTLLEAIKAGAPIIASSAGGNPEVIENGKNGILVDYNDEAQIKSAVEFIFDSPAKAREFAEAARGQAKKFSWVGVVSQTTQVLNGVR